MIGFVSICNLWKFYGSFEVLWGIDFDVVKGEVVCIIGFFGLGKLMLICCINWLEGFFEGSEICVDGMFVILGWVFVKVWVEVGMVFQFFNLFLYLIVCENVMLVLCCVWGMVCVDVVVQVDWLLVCVGIFSQVDKYFEYLLGGQ